MFLNCEKQQWKTSDLWTYWFSEIILTGPRVKTKQRISSVYIFFSLHTEYFYQNYQNPSIKIIFVLNKYNKLTLILNNAPNMLLRMPRQNTQTPYTQRHSTHDFSLRQQITHASNRACDKSRLRDLINCVMEYFLCKNFFCPLF